MTALDSGLKTTTTGLSTIEAVQRRVLWLATSLVHHANRVRPSRSGIKVGGHQASSASIVSIMTALWFEHLRADDLVSVKPHAAPVLHAINYLLGRLDPVYLTELRAFHGLQSYPSRTKDPDPVDFSTGSVVIGATATIWSALAQRYVADHGFIGSGSSPDQGRHIALLGDAELDEGPVWEALVDPMTPLLGNLLWIVDLNRQSLDRVIPDIAVGRIGAMFDAAGWQTLTVKYGRHIQRLFGLPHGELLRARLDDMPNEEYQRLLRAPEADVRDRLCDDGAHGADLRRAMSDVSDAELQRAVRDLGGHDLQELSEAMRTADATLDRPTVIFAYTIKAWGLPTQGHPSNHSALLSDEQWITLGTELGADPSNPWMPFDAHSPESELCARTAARLQRAPRTSAPNPKLPDELGRNRASNTSTQQAFGRFFVDLAHAAPDASARVVTVSPDVASSTNLGNWINRVGVWSVDDRRDWFSEDRETLMHWKEGGQHIELGIAEVNLVGLLGELGSTWSRWGQPLFPVGTIYDPFVTRALEPWSFGHYAGGQSILVGTPSGVSLAPEGGAHQSVITPSIGLEQPGCVSWEPCFAQDLEWTMLEAMRRLGHADGESSYFRLSTRPIDQSLAALPIDAAQREQRRRLTVAGGYPLRRATAAPNITLVGVGVIMPEVLAAADALTALDVAVDVICVTSPDLLFRAFQARQGLGDGSPRIIDALFPAARTSPIVTVHDGHPHTLSFVAGVRGVRIACLGVSDFGQVGELDELYRHYGIDTATIIGAAWDLLEEP
ncbi:MAG: pyruvate dehydrogenase [Ilumatobacteraceae bacterium]